MTRQAMADPRSTVVDTRGGLEVHFERARVLVEDGPDRGLERVLLDRPLVIGRGEDADLPLTDPRVSRAHAVIQPVEGGYRVKDLGSAGGTFLDGIQVESAPLKPDAEVRLGDTALRFRVKRARERAPAHEGERFEGMVGASAPMRRLFGMVKKLGALDLPVLVLGESGTGKEGLARALHRHSGVREGPFEVVDCTLLSPEHLRSELFGHTKGAFTGADASREGAFERADGGTVFLDEVGELPLDIQPALLRVLQEGEVRPLGSERTIRVRVRVLAATHRDLPARVRAGGFRADLYYRLSALALDVPPLRDRAGDLPLLVKEILPDGPALMPEALEALETHPWPGNVRELQNVLRRAAAVAEGDRIAPRDLRFDALGAEPDAPRALRADPLSKARTVAEAEERLILDALEACGGNRKEAAKRLGMARSTLYRKLGKMGID